MKNEISEVKKKREFSQLPDSVVEKALEITKGDVKEARALLRKYFGVFLTNRVLKSSEDSDEVLKFHLSSKNRNYESFYKEIKSCIGGVKSSVDFGAGVNGFSYPILREIFGDVHYLAMEAAGQLVDKMNSYFKYRGFESAHAIKGDLFDLNKIRKMLPPLDEPIVAFMFQVVDALESLEKDFSKKFLLEISKKCRYIVLTLPTESLGGRKKFAVQRKWILDFLKENFETLKDFESGSERVLCVRKK
ncbi:MAG: hypothetical protein BV456_05440 [Thermoplasmata archaeon M8B2D]|nr:MAG: hypothetical protein BV456_05440 [Thermoplasmata archaeon M8B2D]